MALVVRRRVASRGHALGREHRAGRKEVMGVSNGMSSKRSMALVVWTSRRHVRGEEHGAGCEEGGWASIRMKS